MSLLFVLLFMVLFPLFASGDAAVLTVELIDLREVRNRVILDRGQTRFLFLDIRGQNGPPCTIAGFGSPGCTAGPLSLSGLLREIRNPLGYRPASAVLREPSTLGLDTDFSWSAGGISLNVIPDRITAYGLRHRSCPSAGLLFSQLQTASPVRWEALLSASEPAPRSVGEEWYPELQGFPGGWLVHAAGRVFWAFSSAIAAFSGAASGGELSQPGGFAHSAIRWQGKQGEAFLMGGLCSDAYLDPEGRAGEWARCVGAVLRGHRGEIWQGEVEYLRRTAPARGRPSAFCEAQERMEARLQGLWRRGSRFRARIQASGRLSRYHLRDGSLDPEALVGLGAEAFSRQHGFSAAAVLGRKSGVVDGELRCRWEYAPKDSQGAFLEACMEVRGEMEITCGVELRLGKGSLEGRIVLRPDGAESRIRWQTTSASD